MDDAPTAADYDSVERATQALKVKGWRAAFSLNEMINGWDQLVHEIEIGYDATIDDFTNDLTTRDWIAECRELVTDLIRRSIDERVSLIDDRYKRATVDDDGRALGHFFRIEGKGWWWFRRPLADQGELATYLRDHGLT